jgi:hypothetical protein
MEAETLRLTRPQKVALNAMRANLGEASELTLWMEGLNLPRLTMVALQRRGLVQRGEYLNEDYGYLWHLAPLTCPTSEDGE